MASPFNSAFVGILLKILVKSFAINMMKMAAFTNLCSRAAQMKLHSCKVNIGSKRSQYASLCRVRHSRCQMVLTFARIDNDQFVCD